MGRFKKKPKRGTKIEAKSNQDIKHPIDKLKHYPRIPQGTQPRGAILPSLLPRMNDFRAVAPIKTPSQPDLVERARVRLWRSMPGFIFRVPFLTHDETARVTSAFGLLGDNPKASHDSLLAFLTELFDWMAGHEYAYCAEKDSKTVFYAFARLEYYNSLVPRRATRSRLTAFAAAAVDVQLLIELVEGFVAARRAAQNERALEALVARPPAPVRAGAETPVGTMAQEESNSATRRSRRVAVEFEKAATALTERLGNQLTMDDGEGGLKEGQEMPVDGPTQEAEGKEAGREVTYWSEHMLKNLAIAVDHWLRCLKNQEECGRGLEWARMFDPDSRSLGGSAAG